MNSSFVLKDKISESSTTSVYKAFHTKLNRIVILKILHNRLTADENTKTRFEREARALANFQCENIVRVFDLTEVDGCPAIVMEFVDGQSLADLIAQKGYLPEQQVKKIAVDVLQGLAIAHQNGIIHRDIKPGNILISSSGVVKLTDFGLATVAQLPTVTIEGTMLGTPAYMSPEQAKGENLDAKTDLFSLGLTLLEALSGDRLCDGKSYAECLKKVINFDLKQVNQYEGRFQSDLIEFLRKLLSPQPRQRFATAEDALSFLNRSIFSSQLTLKEKSKKKTAVVVLSILFSISSIFVVNIYLHQDRQQVSDITKIEPKIFVSADSTDKAQPKIIRKKDLNAKSKQKHVLSKQKPEKLTSSAEHEQPRFISNDTGIVYIICKPWAKIFLNEEYVGETPLKPLKLSAGSYNVMFTHPYFIPIVKTIQVIPGKEQIIQNSFLEQAGYIKLQVVPWGKIYIDDQYRETTPISRPLIVSAGKRRLRFENPSFNIVEREVLINSGETTYVYFNFKDTK